MLGRNLPPPQKKTLILTSSICNNTLSKPSHIFEVLGAGCQHMDLGTSQSTADVMHEVSEIVMFHLLLTEINQ